LQFFNLERGRAQRVKEAFSWALSFTRGVLVLLLRYPEKSMFDLKSCVLLKE
jgi:hypothetical protein